MRLKQLQYFQEVARTGSITAASNNLYVTQQALSTAVKNLEEELDTTLLKRSPSGVTLTEAGQEVLIAAQQIAHILEDLEQRLAHPSQTSITGTIRLMLNEGLRQTFFPEIYSHFYKEHPEIKLTYSTGTLEAIEQALLAEHIDFGLASLPRIGQDTLLSLSPSVAFVPLKQLRFSVYVHQDSPLAQYKSISLRHLLKYPLIMQAFQPQDQYPIYQILCRYGTPQIVPSDSAYFTQQMLRDNNAAALFPVQYNLAVTNVTPIRLRDDISVILGYLYARQLEPFSPLLQLFADHLVPSHT